jgi:hypothetical protein
MVFLVPELMPDELPLLPSWESVAVELDFLEDVVGVALVVMTLENVLPLMVTTVVTVVGVALAEVEAVVLPLPVVWVVLDAASVEVVAAAGSVEEGPAVVLALGVALVAAESVVAAVVGALVLASVVVGVVEVSVDVAEDEGVSVVDGVDVEEADVDVAVVASVAEVVTASAVSAVVVAATEVFLASLARPIRPSRFQAFANEMAKKATKRSRIRPEFCNMMNDCQSWGRLVVRTKEWWWSMEMRAATRLFCKRVGLAGTKRSFSRRVRGKSRVVMKGSVKGARRQLRWIVFQVEASDVGYCQCFGGLSMTTLFPG